jgi:hypothetical protein
MHAYELTTNICEVLSLVVFEGYLSLPYVIFVLFAHHSYIKNCYEIPNATI